MLHKGLKGNYVELSLKHVDAKFFMQDSNHSLAIQVWLLKKEIGHFINHKNY